MAMSEAVPAILIVVAVPMGYRLRKRLKGFCVILVIKESRTGVKALEMYGAFLRERLGTEGRDTKSGGKVLEIR